ncbi:DNA repair family protein-like protein [Xylariomycetidae sp. FL2044]|nr:DNA repair family protein-like protein [Xylariomycetidae sp. FL2044]
MSSKKRTIDAFFSAPKSNKKPRNSDAAEYDILNPPQQEDETTPTGYTTHPTYPFPIPHLPPAISRELASLPSSVGRAVNDGPDLDLLYFEPYVPRAGGTARALFEFLRARLPFYRVEYDIKRGGVETHIRTPRWTTVFGIDETSRFDDRGVVVAAAAAAARDTSVPTKGRANDHQKGYYAKYPPRPIPKCLDDLRVSTEAATGCRFNFCLVNYYASGSDSISYHSDDERFLGPLPAIASFSLGARRDFLMKHKPIPPDDNAPAGVQQEPKPLKLPLASGDMILMRGKTQANWLHSIPKRSGKNEKDGGRINITFRRAMVKGGTENYYNYNVGTGPVYRWDANAQEMKPWKPEHQP